MSASPPALARSSRGPRTSAGVIVNITVDGDGVARHSGVQRRRSSARTELSRVSRGGRRGGRSEDALSLADT